MYTGYALLRKKNQAVHSLSESSDRWCFKYKILLSNVFNSKYGPYTIEWLGKGEKWKPSLCCTSRFAWWEVEKICHTFSFTFKTSDFAWLKCCVMQSRHIPKFEFLKFPFELSEEKFRHRVGFGGRSDLNSSILIWLFQTMTNLNCPFSYAMLRPGGRVLDPWLGIAVPPRVWNPDPL